MEMHFESIASDKCGPRRIGDEAPVSLLFCRAENTMMLFARSLKAQPKVRRRNSSAAFLASLFRVVKSVFPTNADIIWQGRTQHDVLRSDVENILVPWFGHSPEQATVAGAGLDDEAVDFMRHGFSCA